MDPVRFNFDGILPQSLDESDAVHQACECFVQHGYALLDHVVPEKHIAVLRAEFEAHYASYLVDRELNDSLLVGDRRYMFAVRLSGGFADPAIFANPCVLAVVRRVLQDDAALEAFGAINSLPGSASQLPHRDGPALFASDISALLPAHALTCALPLVSMDEAHGTTAIWPGSHRWKEYEPSKPAIEPTIPVGSCLLWDFRLFHSGTPNRSRQHRPMLYSTYARRWYQDPVNFAKGTLQRLTFGPCFLGTLPPETRRLFPTVG